MKASAIIAAGLGAAWLAWCAVGAIPWGVAPAPPANASHAPHFDFLHALAADLQRIRHRLSRVLP